MKNSNFKKQTRNSWGKEEEIDSNLVYDARIESKRANGMLKGIANIFGEIPS